MSPISFRSRLDCEGRQIIFTRWFRRRLVGVVVLSRCSRICALLLHWHGGFVVRWWSCLDFALVCKVLVSIVRA
ncbi:hypothetical protein PRUPE_1G296200 [Prunus persica]|uniref:Uncharacterized protein n=1 Tax=Prunus persica TaxID=3760 RepID=A0A251R542_PRUPE|nr:hypothetical protein PRUPE_1G296200 [Prunus persica]